MNDEMGVPGETGKAASPAAAALGMSHGSQAAGSAQAAHNQRRDEMALNSHAQANPNDGLVVLPQGGFRRISDYFVDHDYIAEDHSSIFADPSRFMENPDPTSMYVWAAKSDKYTFARIRSHMYRPVEAHELREDTDLPIETHRVAGIDELMVACYDLILLEVPAKAVKRLYKWREMQAVLRTQSNLPFQQLKDQIERDSHGGATAEFGVKVE